MRFFTTTLSFVYLLLAGCATVHQSDEVLGRTQNHQIIAVLPPEVAITALKNDSTADTRLRLRQVSDNLQRQVYFWLLQRSAQQKLSVKVQDIAYTREVLSQHGYYDGKTLTTQNLCTILGVNAVVSPYFEFDQPMSAGSAALVSLASNNFISLASNNFMSGVTNSIYADLKLYDKTSEAPFWDYSMTINGTTGSIPAELIDKFMKKATTKMPYSK